MNHLLWSTWCNSLVLVSDVRVLRQELALGRLFLAIAVLQELVIRCCKLLAQLTRVQLLEIHVALIELKLAIVELLLIILSLGCFSNRSISNEVNFDIRSCKGVVVDEVVGLSRLMTTERTLSSFRLVWSLVIEGNAIRRWLSGEHLSLRSYKSTICNRIRIELGSRPSQAIDLYSLNRCFREGLQTLMNFASLARVAHLF